MSLDFVTDPELVPKPRNEITIQKLSAHPYPDNWRVKVVIAITPFAPSDRPNLEIVAVNADNKAVSSLSIIESVQKDLTLTLHLTGEEHQHGKYTLHAALYFDPDHIQHVTQTTFTIDPMS